MTGFRNKSRNDRTYVNLGGGWKRTFKTACGKRIRTKTNPISCITVYRACASGETPDREGWLQEIARRWRKYQGTGGQVVLTESTAFVAEIKAKEQDCMKSWMCSSLKSLKALGNHLHVNFAVPWTESISPWRLSDQVTVRRFINCRGAIPVIFWRWWQCGRAYDEEGEDVARRTLCVGRYDVWEWKKSLWMATQKQR